MFCRQLIFCSLTSLTAVTHLENIRQLNIGRGKKLGFQLSHRLTLIKKVLIKTYITIRSFDRKNIFREKKLLRPKNWTFSREWTFASANKSSISQFQSFVNLPKNREIAKLCFAKVSYFKVYFLCVSQKILSERTYNVLYDVFSLQKSCIMN